MGWETLKVSDIYWKKGWLKWSCVCKQRFLTCISFSWVVSGVYSNIKWLMLIFLEAFSNFISYPLLQWLKVSSYLFFSVYLSSSLISWGLVNWNGKAGKMSKIKLRGCRIRTQEVPFGLIHWSMCQAWLGRLYWVCMQSCSIFWLLRHL